VFVAERGRGVAGAREARGAALCLIGIAATAALRAAVGAPDTAASMPAGAVFAVALLAVAIAAGWRPARPTVAGAVLGIAGGGVLVGAWLFSHAGPGIHVAPVNAGLALWTPVVALIAVAEEIAMRGALFDTVRTWCGDGGALIATTLVFAALHVPLYGIGSLPLDLAAGLLLGGLRVVSRGVLAPAVAHVIADLAGGWLL
jgi:membrane protease YdiL (CAAX protease family)